MKKFSFRLKRVLEYRKNVEKLAQKELYNARKEYLEGEKTIDRMRGEKKVMAADCRRKIRHGMAVSRYQIYGKYLTKMEVDLKNAGTALRLVGEKVEKKTEILKQALIKKKTLEMMENTQYNNYLEQLEKESQKTLDELVILNRGHNI